VLASVEAWCAVLLRKTSILSSWQSIAQRTRSGALMGPASCLWRPRPRGGGRGVWVEPYASDRAFGCPGPQEAAARCPGLVVSAAWERSAYRPAIWYFLISSWSGSRTSILAFRTETRMVAPVDSAGKRIIGE